VRLVSFDLVQELKRLARGQKTKVEPWLLAALAARRLQDKGVEELEQLYRLKDPRGR
jgi:hypothetical protein